MANVKFMYNGIKVEGVLHKAHYSKGTYYNLPDGTITIYGKSYNDLPKVEGLGIENNTDTMTDYFENDRIRVTPDNKLYKEVHQAWEKQETKRQAVIAKRNKK